MKLTFGVTKNKKTAHEGIDEKNLIFAYEFETFDENKFIELMQNKYEKITELVKPISKEDIVCYLIDLEIPNKEKLLGGCSISGATILATKMNVIEMAYKQLSRQIQTTIKKEVIDIES